MHATSKNSGWKGLLCLLVLVAASPACLRGSSPLLTADPTGSVLWEQGQDALVAAEWRDAVSSFDTLLRNYPSSPFLAEARLGMGRAYYEQGRVESLIMGIDAFQSFLTYHPSHSEVAYAQYMVAMTYVAQMRTADRDQTPTRQAIDAFQLLIDTHPGSPLYDEAVRRRVAAIDLLAQHELQVARWQSGRDQDWDAAIDRVEFALEEFPDTSIKCELHFTKAEAYRHGNMVEEALVTYEQVINDYPDCEMVEQAQERVEDLRGS